MSSAADRARAKAAQLTAAAQPTTSGPLQEEVSGGVSAVTSSPPVSTKPIRVSLDLAPALFDELTVWRTRAARQLGRGRVTNVDALRVLVRLLLTDEELTGRVVAHLRQESTQ